MIIDYWWTFGKKKAEANIQLEGLREQTSVRNVYSSMTPVGHTITGLAAAAAVFPSGLSRRRTAAGLAVIVLLANIPDLRIAGWGHYAYHISHSIFVTGGLIAIALLGLRVVSMCGGPRVPKYLLVGGAAAWLSHLLLDTLYAHGHGLAMFWPFSSWALALPVPLFSGLGSCRRVLTLPGLRTVAIEFLCFSPLLAGVLVIRRILKPKTPVMAGGEI
jgi:membrane-bound metal-dependent hydrolase YbcI (DUF457 family)